MRTEMKNCLIYIKNLCKSIQKKQEDIKQHKRNAVRLDAHSSIQPTPAFAKLALVRSCVCIRSRVLLIWKWIATAQVE